MYITYIVVINGSSFLRSPGTNLINSEHVRYMLQLYHIHDTRRYKENLFISTVTVKSCELTFRLAFVRLHRPTWASLNRGEYNIQLVEKHSDEQIKHVFLIAF